MSPLPSPFASTNRQRLLPEPLPPSLPMLTVHIGPVESPEKPGCHGVVATLIAGRAVPPVTVPVESSVASLPNCCTLASSDRDVLPLGV